MRRHCHRDWSGYLSSKLKRRKETMRLLLLTPRVTEEGKSLQGGNYKLDASMLMQSGFAPGLFGDYEASLFGEYEVSQHKVTDIWMDARERALGKRSSFG